MTMLRGYSVVAFGCVLVSGLMGLLHGRFVQWVFQQGDARERVATFIGGYSCLTVLVRDVGLLLFLVALLIADQSAAGRKRDAEY